MFASDNAGGSSSPSRGPTSADRQSVEEQLNNDSVTLSSSMNLSSVLNAVFGKKKAYKVHGEVDATVDAVPEDKVYEGKKDDDAATPL